MAAEQPELRRLRFPWGAMSSCSGGPACTEERESTANGVAPTWAAVRTLEQLEKSRD